ncbi:MAG: hypothetical protein IKN27_12305 [Selenomonadaceae bacterium]|nr:hypothetical protein [Selenomonadaceae bacterium]
MTNFELTAGDRFVLEDGERFAFVESGKVEVYAVTRAEGSFRQQFLAELNAGGVAFPSLDEFGQTETQIHAVEDSRIQIFTFNEVAPENLKIFMRELFAELIKLPWLSLLADKGDDTLIKWREKNFLDDAENLTETFAENEGIFSMLLGVRFASEDKKFSRRVEVRERNQRRIVDDAISNLFGEEHTNYSETLSRNVKIEEATFIVHRVAKYFNQSTDDIRIAPELTKKLDQIRILRRLMQKGNMQMRLVTLVEDWHKKDSGILIGYYGEEKTLAVFVPTAPGEYKIVTRQNPDGIKLTDDEAKKIDASAFECYGGFPARELKIFDLLKFIFKQCWVADYKTVIAVGLFSGLIPLVMPIVTETIFQDIIPILDRQGLATVTQVTMVTSFTMASLGIVRTIAVMRITTRIDMATEAALWNRLLTLPTKFFRQYTSGELASRMGGMSVIKGLVSPEFIGSLFGFVFSFWSIFLMCYYSLKLTGVAITVWFVYAIITAFIYRRVIGFNRKLIEANNQESGMIQQIFAGLAKFREHGAEKQAYYLWS